VFPSFPKIRKKFQSIDPIFVPLFQDYNKILTIVSSEGEIVHLERPVRAEGSVEVPALYSLLSPSLTLQQK
jgi:hypothetical protein